MTLSTHLRIIGDVSPEGVFAKMRELIGIPQDQPFVIESERKGYSDDSEPTGWMQTRSQPGGFGAMFWMTVAIGREPVNRDLLWHDETYCAADAADGFPCKHEAGETPPCNIEIMLDSPYSYHDEEGRDCSAWHHHLTGQLGAWLEAQGRDWLSDGTCHAYTKNPHGWSGLNRACAPGLGLSETNLRPGGRLQARVPELPICPACARIAGLPSIPGVTA